MLEDIKKCLAFCKQVQDKEYSKDLVDVIGSYQTGYADAVGDIMRLIIAEYPEAIG